VTHYNQFVLMTMKTC